MLEGVAGGALGTRANRNVVEHGAEGVGAANADAWVDAAVAHARLVHGAVRVAGTFGATAVVRVAVVVAHAFADGVVVVDATMGVVTARRRIAWVQRLFGLTCDG